MRDDVLEIKKYYKVYFWALGKSVKSDLARGSILQLLVSGLDILFLSLIAPFVLSISNSEQSRPKILILGELDTGVLLLLILVVTTVRSLLSLFIENKILKKLAIREAEISSVFTQASLFEKIDRAKSSNSVDLLHLVNSIINSIFTNVFRPSVRFFSDLMTYLSVIVTLFILTPKIAIIVLLYSTVVSFFALRYLGRKQRKIGAQMLNSERNSLRIFQEIKHTGLQLKLSNIEGGLLSNFYEQRRRFTQDKSLIFILAALPKFIVEFFLIFGLYIYFLVASIVGSSVISISTLALLTAAGFRILPSIATTIVFISNLNNASSAIKKFDELGKRFNLRGSEINFVNNLTKTFDYSFSGDLVFDRVSFKYQESKKDIIDNFSIRIAQKTTTLIEGVNGSGKTTWIYLALGLLEAQSGQIYMEDNGEKVPMTERISGISFVSQEVNFFDESIGYNIALRPIVESDLPALIGISTKVGLLSKVESTNSGFNMHVGENGSKLSAGERQKVGIARSLFSSPSLLVLDEPTANLDSLAEKEIWKVLQELKGDLTLVIVSHREVPSELYEQKIELALPSAGADVKAIVGEFHDQIT